MAACGAAGRGFESLWARSDIGAFKWVLTYKRCKERVEVGQLQSDPWTLYLYAMKSPVTKVSKKTWQVFRLPCIGRRYNRRESRTFVEMARKDSNWTFNSILRFVQFQNDRVLKKEITSATVRNYVKSIKLLCEMADLPIVWKKITRGLSKGRRYADDRIPTIEEIKKLIGYPDRRIKALQGAMTTRTLPYILTNDRMELITCNSFFILKLKDTC